MAIMINYKLTGVILYISKRYYSYHWFLSLHWDIYGINSTTAESISIKKIAFQTVAKWWESLVDAQQLLVEGWMRLGIVGVCLDGSWGDIGRNLFLSVDFGRVSVLS